MFTHCLHCGRALTRDDRMVKTRIGWISTMCAAGDGPLACLGSDRVYNQDMYYCTIRDGETCLFMGDLEDAESFRSSLWLLYGIKPSEVKIVSVFET